MTASRHTLPLNVAFTALCLAAVVAVKLVASPALGHETPFLLFSAAVALSACLFGFGYGAAAAAAAAVLSDYFFVGESRGFATAPDDLIKVAVFFFQSLVVGWACARLRRTCSEVGAGHTVCRQ